MMNGEEFKVEDGFSLPHPGHGKTKPKYPWLEMKVGQSFVVQNPPVGFRSNAHVFGSRNKMKFSVRKQPDGSMRVWRVK